MALPRRISLLFFIGIFAAGSTALGYYYYFVYEPPLQAAEKFMEDMERSNQNALYNDVVVSVGLDGGSLRTPEESDIRGLLADHFRRGRILDQHTREGRTRDYYYLVYREPDGRVYAMVVTMFNGRYRVVVPEPHQSSRRHRYLWDYTWTN
jgi:hypothetical protein